MADKKSLVPRSSSVPATIRSPALPTLPSGPHFLGTATGVARRNAAFVDAHTGHLDARRRQTDAMAGLVDSRITLAAKLADLHNVLFELQRERAHHRAVAADRRSGERQQAAFDQELAVARHEAALSRVREQAVRAQRNLEAAQRVAPAEVDAWYAAAQARRNNALAEYQDTAADLSRSAPAGNTDALKEAVAAELAQVLAMLDHQIELEKQRGNADAAATLQNMRARLKAAGTL